MCDTEAQARARDRGELVLLPLGKNKMWCICWNLTEYTCHAFTTSPWIKKISKGSLQQKVWCLVCTKPAGVWRRTILGFATARLAVASLATHLHFSLQSAGGYDVWFRLDSAGCGRRWRMSAQALAVLNWKSVLPRVQHHLQHHSNCGVWEWAHNSSRISAVARQRISSNGR